MILPGCLIHGGSSGNLIPTLALDKWRTEFGMGQHHILWLELSNTNEARFKGQLELAEKILKAGGEVQWMIWGTPAYMASVPTTWDNWHKYPPDDYDFRKNLFGKAQKNKNLDRKLILRL